jgi:3-methyladenine DNA glycosylase AlkD
MESDLISRVRSALWMARTPANLKGMRLRTPAVRAVSRDLFREVRDATKAQIFDFCEQLLATRDSDARLIAFDWAFRCRKHYAGADFDRFERWLVQFVDGWDSCDDFCTHAFGSLVYRYPECLPAVKVWTQADNRWLRRAAAVVLIYGARRHSLHTAAFEIADLLLLDEDDLVQKGYGWLLKEVSKRAPQPVFDYVMQRKAGMPRTALRYAIEKLDPALRQQAMER